jgi:hypothetical protein
MEQGNRNNTKFIDLFNYEEFKGEINNEPSQTIPDETYSIREILQRFSRGLTTTTKTGFYDEEDYHPDITKMDLVDREEYIENVKIQLHDLQQSLNSQDKDTTVEHVVTGE